MKDVINMKLYQISDIGTDYIHSNDIYEIAAKTPIIGTAEFILECFKCNVFELDGIQYTADQLDTATKIQCLIDDGFVKKIS